MLAPFGVILAGGPLTFDGALDKPLMTLSGRPVLAHVIDRLSPQVADLALSANGDPARFAAFGLTVLPDPVPDFPGPLAGVLAALDWAAPRGADAVVSVSADTPFLPCDLVPRLLLAADGMDVPLSMAVQGDVAHPICALWPVALRDALFAAIEAGEHKAGLWARQNGARRAVFPEDAYSFFDINTAQDLARAEEEMS